MKKPIKPPKPPQYLVCYCCGVRYVRGYFQCCTRPNGMRKDIWADQWCAPVQLGGCGKCPKHCECPERVRDRPLAEPLKEFMANLELEAGRRERAAL